MHFFALFITADMHHGRFRMERNSGASEKEESKGRSIVTRKILVVDDEPFALKSVSFVLKRGGYAVKEGKDGMEALDLIRQWKPDIVFLDIMMPKKNGYEVCREVRQDPALKGTHIIMLTAKGQGIDKTQALEAGADDYLTKPFSPILLLKKVEEVFQQVKNVS